MGTQIREILGNLTDLERRGLGKLKVGLFKFLGKKKFSDFSVGIQTLPNAYDIRKWAVACHLKFTYCLHFKISSRKP